VLQCVAVCCSVNVSIFNGSQELPQQSARVLQCVAMCCSVLQCIAVRMSPSSMAAKSCHNFLRVSALLQFTVCSDCRHCNICVSFTTIYCSTLHHNFLRVSALLQFTVYSAYRHCNICVSFTTTYCNTLHHNFYRHRNICVSETSDAPHANST